MMIRGPRGPVDVLVIPGDKPPVLFFPGGHCTAASDCGWDLYTAAGHGVIAFSRPGYGRTAVGAATAGEFVGSVAACCHELGVQELAGAVGVSFGGLQAAETAVRMPGLVPRLVLSSCAPSSLPYPDTRRTALAAHLAFRPLTQHLTWRAVASLVSTDVGLRAMASSMSTRPASQWWASWSQEDKDRARALFRSMSSSRGFVLDMRQGGSRHQGHRRQLLRRVPCPTLVTGSRADGAVDFAHALDLAANIPQARLVELSSPTHLFWLGPGRRRLCDTIHRFLAGQ